MPNPRQLLARMGAVFAAAAIPNVGVGAALGVDAWRSALMAGAIAVLEVLRRIAEAYRADGKLTADELEDAVTGEAAE